MYLSEDDAEALRLEAQATGRSQAELIREGVRRVLRRPRKRVFHSMGKGKGPGGPTPLGWDADELHRKVMGSR